MLFLLLITGTLSTTALVPVERAALPADSIGRVVQGGKTYLKHKVAKGDSFYAIARKYRIPMDQLVAANPKVAGTLSIGQVVLVPRATVVLAAKSDAAPILPRAEKPLKVDKAAGDRPTAPVAGGVGRATGGRIHTVASGQTLSAIARKYHVSVADIRRWNNLKNDNLRLKQQLIVQAAAPVAPAGGGLAVVAERDEKPAVVPKNEGDKVEEPVAVPRRETSTEVASEQPVRAPVSVAAANDTMGDVEIAESLRKVTESGMAEVIESSGESSKFLALHRTAAVGSLLQVKNPQNGQSVYVRVIGKLPPTGANENVVIRLSKRALQKLQVVDQRFRVEVSYMP